MKHAAALYRAEADRLRIIYNAGIQRVTADYRGQLLAVLAALQARAMASPDCRLDTHAIQAAATGTLYLTPDEQAQAVIVLRQWQGETLNPMTEPSPSEIADNADRQAESDYAHSDGAHAPD